MSPKVRVGHSRILEQRDRHALIVSAVGCAPGGNMKMTMKKLTQAMAIIPEAMDHLPSENGPGLNVLRPVVTRRTIGVIYEMYSAITDDLP